MAKSKHIEHLPVMCEAATDALLVGGGGVFVDATFGGGGHSKAILRKIPADSSLIALDCDEFAEEHAAGVGDKRFQFFRRNFSQLSEVLAEAGVQAVRGVLFDLGFSSLQLACAERGFSFQRTGDLDMRLDRRQGLTVCQWLRQADEKDIARVLKEYGEEPEARRLARALAARCGDIHNTADLSRLVAQTKLRPTPGCNPATRVFQALRIAVNQELDNLLTGLTAARKHLCVGGRLAVIAFHSLEDRIVKRFSAGIALPRLGRVDEGDMRSVGGMRRPDKAEIMANPRSRSACLRVFEKSLA